MLSETQFVSRGAAEVSERTAVLNGVEVHYLDCAGDGPMIVLLHGLSANANEFGGLINAGLSPRYRVVAPDLRGRGRSGKPLTGYRMADHAADVMALLDMIGVGSVVMGGHSFGGLLAIYIAAHFPDRVSRVIVIDAAIQMHPDVRKMIQPSLDRLGKVLPSVGAYISEMQTAPHLAGFWDSAIDGYFRAEIHENTDGTVQSLTSADAIVHALEGAQMEPWRDLVTSIRHPVLLLNARGEYGPPGSPPIVPPERALDTACAFNDCQYVEVPGNHLTMVFGENASTVAGHIDAFVRRGHGLANAGD